MNSTTDRLSAARLADDQAGPLTVGAHGTDILTYAHRPELPASECPGPAPHPLRTLGGGTVTKRRPNEHRHQKGLVKMAMHLSGQNLVGGSTYVPGAPGHGYADLPNDVGRLDHTGFADVAAAGRPGFTETPAWRTADGEHWIDELRTVTVAEVDPDGGHWNLEFATEPHDVRGETLTFGSPRSTDARTRATAAFSGAARVTSSAAGSSAPTGSKVRRRAGTPRGGSSAAASSTCATCARRCCSGPNRSVTASPVRTGSYATCRSPSSIPRSRSTKSGTRRPATRCGCATA